MSKNKVSSEDILSYIREYLNFVNDFPINGKNVNKMTDLGTVRAIGFADEILDFREAEDLEMETLDNDFLSEIEYLKEADSEEIFLGARDLYNDQFISTSFFYYWIAKRKKKVSIEEIINNTQTHFGIDGSYVCHKMPSRFATRKEITTVILDFENTIDTVSNLDKLFKNYIEENYVSKGREYYIVIASSSGNLRSRIEKLSSRYLKRINAIFTVPKCSNYRELGETLKEDPKNPGYFKTEIYWDQDSKNMNHKKVPRLVRIDENKANEGKVLTGMCQLLGIDSEDAINITNDPSDQSIDKTKPIVTLVVPSGNGYGADVWANVTQDFMSRGNGNIYLGAQRLIRHPRPRQDMESPRKERRYNVGGVPVYRTTRFPNAFYLGHTRSELKEMK